MANNVDILGDEVALLQIINDDFSATDGRFEDDIITNLSNGSMLSQCTTLKTLNLPNLTTVTFYSFSGCPRLQKAYLPKLTDTKNNIFEEDFGLRFLDIGKSNNLIQGTLQYCYDLSAIVMRKNGVVPYGNNTGADNGLYNFAGDVHAYVPRNTIEDYKIATNWATIVALHPNFFLPLEDYTVDGTINGAIDESLIYVPHTPVYSLDEQSFDGSTYIDTGVNLFDGTNNFTICIDFELWASGMPAYSTLFNCASGNSNTDVGFLVRKDNNQTKLSIAYYPPGTSSGASSTSYLDNNTRFKMYFISDGNTGRMKVRIINANNLRGGIMRFSKTGTQTSLDKTLIIGANRASDGTFSQYWKGMIHKVRVYKDVLSPWECLDVLGV